MAKPKQFTFEYRHEGKRRTLSMDASSFEDAQAQLNAAYFSGEPQEVVFTIRAPRWFFKGK